MVALRRESTRPVTVQYSHYVTHGDRSFMPFLGHCLRANHINTRPILTFPSKKQTPSSYRLLQSSACKLHRVTTATANDTGKPVAHHLRAAVLFPEQGAAASVVADPGPG